MGRQEIVYEDEGGREGGMEGGSILFVRVCQAELERHGTRDSCWIALGEKVTHTHKQTHTQTDNHIITRA